jgi:hypothetical protein
MMVSIVTITNNVSFVVIDSTGGFVGIDTIVGFVGIVSIVDMILNIVSTLILHINMAISTSLVRVGSNIIMRRIYIRVEFVRIVIKFIRFVSVIRSISIKWFLTSSFVSRLSGEIRRDRNWKRLRETKELGLTNS